jgi:hypothetical protein
VLVLTQSDVAVMQDFVARLVRDISRRLDSLVDVRQVGVYTPAPVERREERE